MICQINGSLIQMDTFTVLQIASFLKERHLLPDRKVSISFFLFSNSMHRSVNDWY